MIALHDNLELKSWRPNGPIVISLLKCLPSGTCVVSAIIGVPSRNQLIVGNGLPESKKNSILFLEYYNYFVYQLVNGSIMPLEGVYIHILIAQLKFISCW